MEEGGILRTRLQDDQTNLGDQVFSNLAKSFSVLGFRYSVRIKISLFIGLIICLHRGYLKFERPWLISSKQF